MDCCNKNKQKPQKDEENKNKKGILSGIIYGLVPHIGCIGFIIFSIFGVTAATAVFRPLLLNRYFFHILILISFVFATISALVYLKKNGILSFWGFKRKKGYLLTLYGTTIGINLLLFMVIFPIAANFSPGASLTESILTAFGKNQELVLSDSFSLITLKVDIPCPGHAFLIIDELDKIVGVENISFRFPNLFDINYHPEKANQEEILSLEIFNIYPASIYTSRK